jgi:hypothetical protein
MVYDPHVRGGRKERVRQRLAWLGHACRFFNQALRNLPAMTPHDSLVRGSTDAYCLARPGHEYAVYSWRGASFRLDLSGVKNATVTGRFYDPRTGCWQPEIKLSGGQIVEIHKPTPEDWAFHVYVN